MPTKRIQAATAASTKRRADFGCRLTDDFVIDATDKSTWHRWVLNEFCTRTISQRSPATRSLLTAIAAENAFTYRTHLRFFSAISIGYFFKRSYIVHSRYPSFFAHSRMVNDLPLQAYFFATFPPL